MIIFLSMNSLNTQTWLCLYLKTLNNEHTTFSLQAIDLRGQSKYSVYFSMYSYVEQFLTRDFKFLWSQQPMQYEKKFKQQKKGDIRILRNPIVR